MASDGLPRQQSNFASQSVYIRQCIDPRNNGLIRDKLRLADEELRKNIKKAIAELRLANRLNLNKTGVEIADLEMWERKVDEHTGKCYEIFCRHWNLLGERKTSAFVRVALDILLLRIEQLGGSAAHAASMGHRRRGAIGTSPAESYKDSARAICHRWRTKLDIEARVLDVVAASGKTPEIPPHAVLGDWNHALKTMRTGGMQPGAHRPTHETEGTTTQTIERQTSADAAEPSKGVREGKTVDLLYGQLKRIRGLYRKNGWSPSQIRQYTEQGLAVVWEWADRIRDESRKSAFLRVSDWDDGDGFIFRQIATLYEYAPHLTKKPSWSTIRDWRKSFRGYKRHGTPHGRKPSP